MQRLIAIGLAFCSFFLAVTSLPRLIAQQDPCLTRTVSVTPIDARGIPLQNLQASSLLGKLHGRPVAVLSTTLDTPPHRIMVCVDMSGSMWGSEGAWPVTQTMLEDITQAGPTVGQVGMELFSEKVFDVVNISPNPRAMRMKVALLQRANLEEIVPRRERKTALWDALWQAADQFTPPRSGDVIYALTDGGDNCSHHTEKQLEDKLLSRGIRVFGFVPNVAWRYRSLPEEASGPVAMGDIVRNTGGNLIYLCPDPQDPLCRGLLRRFDDWSKDRRRSILLDAAHQLYQQMAVYYDTRIRLPFALEKRTGWDLAIADNRGRKRRDIGLLYPHRLPPCQKSNPMAPSTPN
jgi:hypothetical protein